MSSPWDRRTRIPRSDRCGIRWRWIACPADPAADRRRSSRRGRRCSSLGSDTGGSIRQPASFCGISGRDADVWASFALRADGVRQFARSHRPVRGKRCAMRPGLLQVIAGRDEMDATSAVAPVPDYCAALDRQYSRDEDRPAEANTLRAWKARLAIACRPRLEVLKKLGCEVRDISLPHTRLRDGRVTTSSRPRKPAPIWRAMTACATPRAPASAEHARRHVPHDAR